MDYPRDERDFLPQQTEFEALEGLPEPDGPVQPITEPNSPRYSLRQLLTGISLGCVGLGFLVPALTSGSCAGATRSSKLKWQEQQAMIQQVIDEKAADGETEHADQQQD